MKYNTNPEMRAKIIDVATRLFYDRGYDKTTFDMIAEECGVAKSLITYHFKTKLNLAVEIFDDNRLQTIAIVNRKISESGIDVPLNAIPSIFDRIALRQLRADRKVYEFFSIVTTEHTLSGNFSGDIYEIFSSAYASGMHEDQFNRMILWTSRGAAAFAITAYFDSKLGKDIPYDVFEDYRASLRYRLQMYPQEEIDKILAVSRSVADQLQIEFLPYFEVK